MKLSKTNSPIKIKVGTDFKVFKCLIEGQNPNGISILHPDAVLLRGEDAFTFMDDFFKTNKDWRDDSKLVVKENGKAFIQILAKLEDTEY